MSAEGSPTGLCPDCRQPVQPGIRICPNCKAFQDWRRYVAIGQTNLALLVALFSVLTTLVTVTFPLLQPRGADIKFLLESMSADTLTILARNDGRSGGVVQLDSVNIAETGNQPELRALWFSPIHTGSYVGVAKEERITVPIQRNDNPPVGQIVCDFLAKTKALREYRAKKITQTDVLGRLTCTLKAKHTGFYSAVGEFETKIDCPRIEPLHLCWGDDE
jgi:hypothetical protein